MTSIRAWAATEARARLTAYEFQPGALAPEQVEIAVDFCGICHSDLSMIDNEWGNSRYPLVPGHEIVGRIVACGEQVKGRRVGDRVGLGWFAASCMHCGQCIAGEQHLCGSGEQTIVGRHGGFADRVRSHWAWATPLPAQLSDAACGPLFCGGITVFGPIVSCGVKPTDRVGVVGIGGLGHLGVKFLSHWGCEVTAFTSSESKRDEALALGAHHVVSTRDSKALKALAGTLDFILVTVNVSLDWASLIGALAPKGRLHVVGAVLEPIPVAAFSLIGGQKAISGSPLGNLSTTTRMLDFCARHAIEPQVEVFPMSQVNAAIEHLRMGKARYRVVLKNDYA